MSVMIRKAGPITPRMIVNRESVGGQMPSQYTAASSTVFLETQANVILSNGTAGAWVKTIDVQGGGTISLLRVLASKPDAARTVRARLTLDGVVVFDATSASIPAAAPRAMEIIGTVHQQSTNQILVFDPIPFSKSCVFEVMTSVDEVYSSLATIGVWRKN